MPRPTDPLHISLKGNLVTNKTMGVDPTSEVSVPHPKDEHGDWVLVDIGWTTPDGGKTFSPPEA